ncbi:MAG: FHA domain-containing protein [Deltaproteobacteria bacterium]|nr:FHA domain-containing protein [Deltaproteobacteria bacterium]
MPRLIISERGKEREEARDLKESPISIGRDQDNIITLASPGVSRRHADILFEDHLPFLVDHGGGNGTALNGKRLTPNERYPLKRGDVITIDTFDLRFAPNGDGSSILPEDEVTETDVLEVKLLKKVLAALDRETYPSLEILNGADEGKKCYLDDTITEVTIGRDPDCSFSIAEHVMSRRHAKISKRWGGIFIRDLESKNGTFVNNRRVVEEYLHDGDRIALGTIVIMFRNPQEVNVAELEPPKPKRAPAKVAPADIPLTEDTGRTAASEEVAAKAPTEKPSDDGVPDFGGESAGAAPAGDYPTPPAPGLLKRLTFFEMGLIGLGSLVLIFALITLVNLLFA